MTRTRRTKILVEGSGALRAALAAAAAESGKVEEIAGPAEGLVMLRLRERARGCLFYMGEVLVTEAKVRVDGHLGVGILAGSRPEAARELALIDAAFNGAFPCVAAWGPLLEEEERRVARERGREAARILRTKVEFESMDRGAPA